MDRVKRETPPPVREEAPPPAPAAAAAAAAAMEGGTPGRWTPWAGPRGAAPAEEVEETLAAIRLSNDRLRATVAYAQRQSFHLQSRLGVGPGPGHDGQEGGPGQEGSTPQEGRSGARLGGPGQVSQRPGLVRRRRQQVRRVSGSAESLGRRQARAKYGGARVCAVCATELSPPPSPLYTHHRSYYEQLFGGN